MALTFVFVLFGTLQFSTVGSLAAEWSAPRKSVSTSYTTKKSVKTLDAKAKKTHKKKTVKTTLDRNTKERGNTKVESSIEKTVTTTTAYKKGSKKANVTRQVKTVTTKYTYEKITAAKKTVRLPAAPTVVDIRSIAPQADAKVLDAFEKTGFKAEIDSSLATTGEFNAAKKLLILKKNDACVYHELGHFLFFCAGNLDINSEGKKIYKAEKGLMTAYNKNYVCSNSGEYFAEAYKNYIENPTALRKERPQTYNYVRTALSKLTNDQIKRIKNIL